MSNICLRGCLLISQGFYNTKFSIRCGRQGIMILWQTFPSTVSHYTVKKECCIHERSVHTCLLKGYWCDHYSNHYILFPLINSKAQITPVSHWEEFRRIPRASSKAVATRGRWKLMSWSKPNGSCLTTGKSWSILVIKGFPFERLGYEQKIYNPGSYKWYTDTRW